MRKTKTFTTLECVARDVRRAKTVADAVELLSAYVGRVIVNTSVQTHAENRRLRGEVRRLRRVIRDVRKCGCAGIGCHAELGAALAPRRRKKP